MQDIHSLLLLDMKIGFECEVPFWLLSFSLSVFFILLVFPKTQDSGSFATSQRYISDLTRNKVSEIIKKKITHKIDSVPNDLLFGQRT